MADLPSQPMIPGEVVDLLARAEMRGIKEDVHELARKMDGLASKGDVSAIHSALAILSQKQDRQSEPKPGLVVSVVSLGVLLLTVVGGFAYWPINTATGDLKSAVIALAERTVSQRQYEADQKTERDTFQQLRADVNVSIQQQRYNADMGRVSSEISLLRDKSLTRSEFEVQHRDIQTFITGIWGERTRQLNMLASRLDRLELLQMKASQ